MLVESLRETSILLQMVMRNLLWIQFLLWSPLCAQGVETRFRDLGSDDFAKREQAQKSLEAWAKDNPKRAIKELSSLYKKTASPETKMRLVQLLKEPVIFEKFGKPPGFVGIHMESGEKRLKGKLLPVVLVKLVANASPAEKYGLLVGDAIFRVDGKPFSRVSHVEFQKRVTAKKEGDSVLLELIREDEIVKVDLILAARTQEVEEKVAREMAARQGRRLPRGGLHNPKEAYFELWLKELEGRK